MHLDHEKLEVYRVELEFLGWANQLIEELSEQKGTRVREILDHLDRASLSAVFNTAEGNGKRQRATRAKFFDDARGSATECAACLDATVAKGACSAERIRKGKELLFRVVSMLCKLVDMYSAPSGVKEDAEDYAATAE